MGVIISILGTLYRFQFIVYFIQLMLSPLIYVDIFLMYLTVNYFYGFGQNIYLGTSPYMLN